MSVMLSDEVACPACGAAVTFDVCLSVNGGRHPHLRRAIVDGSFQRQKCAACGASFRLDPEFSYLDAGGAQWLLVRPAGESPSWQELEGTALDIFGGAFGPGAPGPARELGNRLRPRVVFGWPALREKLVCRDNDLDDVTVELVKLALLRGLDDHPLDDATELRLVDLTPESLIFGWVRASDETILETLRVPRELYTEIAGDADAWAELRAEITAGPFVDVDRLLVPPAVDAAP